MILPRSRIEFTLNCLPTAQQRQRHMRAKNGAHITYKSERQRGNEATLDALLVPHAPEKPLDGALKLEFVACLPIPQSASKKAKEAMRLFLVHPTGKPDLDNLAKQLKDAMTRLRFWHDDRQVTELYCKKRYSDEPFWQISVEQIAEARK